jgi:hypothetical protein
MQISWVLTEKERDRRYNKLKKVGFRNEFRRTNSESSSATPPPTKIDKAVAMPSIPGINFTVEEQLHLENLLTYMRGISKTRYEKYFAFETDCLNHLVPML